MHMLHEAGAFQSGEGTRKGARAEGGGLHDNDLFLELTTARPRLRRALLSSPLIDILDLRLDCKHGLSAIQRGER
jgi:hypothetical protein